MWNLCKHPECESWSRRKDGDYCATHERSNSKAITESKKATSKRTSLLQKAREKQKMPRKKIKSVSDKRKELNKEYFALVEQFKKDNPKCKANVNQFCTTKTDDPHHKKGRGENLLKVETWLPVCRSCHLFITAHPKEAIEKGWSESRLAVNQEKQTI